MTKLEALKTAVKIRGFLYDAEKIMPVTKEIGTDMDALFDKLRDLPDDEVTP